MLMCSHRSLRRGAIALLAPAVMAVAVPAESAAPPPAVAAPALSYADLADLADQAPAVMRARVRKLAVVEPARAGKVRAGWARVYVEAQLDALLAGPPLAADVVRYLADVPLDAKGKLPKLAKRPVLLFARAVTGRPGELQLVAPDAQVMWDAATEARLKGVLGELLAAGAPGRIDRVREAIFVPGNLAGEGETQLFLATADGEPASISVVHEPGKPVHWNVSFSEVVDATALPPARDTLAWYRLACFLPRELGQGANVSATDADKAQAAADYRLVLDGLGACTRTRGGG